jgi:DNA-directed RNA polymerase subunit RPC12/RpoP
MWQRFLPSRNNKNMKEIKSMCETCHQPNQGGEGIEHDKGCPESDEQLTTNNNMNCKECNKKVDQVRVYSEAWQYADVDDKGHITDYRPVEEVTDNTLAIECEYCGYNFLKGGEIKE